MSETLRQHTDHTVNTDEAATKPVMAQDELLQRLHELQTSKIMLEMQNEELRTSLIKSEEEHQIFSNFYDQAPVGFFSIDSQGLILEANSTGANLLGLTKEACVTQPIIKFIRAQDQDLYAHHCRQITECDRPLMCELHIERYDGKALLVRMNSLFAHDVDGNIVHRIVLTDISDCNQVEKALRESEERYHHMLGSVTNYIYTVTVENGIAISTFHGQGCAAVTGYTSEDYSADSNLWYNMIHEEDREAVLDQTKIALEGGAPPPLEHRVIHKDGSVRWISNTLVSRCDATGKLIMYDGLIADITERKIVEEALRESEETYRRQFTDNSSTMLLIDPVDGRIIDANISATHFYGYTIEHLRSMYVTDINTMQYYDVKRYMDMVEPERGTRFEFLHKLADGSLKNVDISVSMIQLGGRKILSSIIYDITDRKRAEEELLTSKSRLAELLSWKDSVINNSAVGILVVGKDRKITEVNRGFLEVFGFSHDELIGQSTRILHVTQEMFQQFGELYWAETSKRKVVNVQWKLRKKNCEVFWCDLTGSAINIQNIQEGVVWVIIDISERKRLQEIMVQTEKMMSLGGLAAGMAHEINNPLGIILQSVQVALMRLAPNNEANRVIASECGCDIDCLWNYLEKRRVFEFLNGVRVAGTRAAKIVADILEFSRKSTSGKSPVAISVRLTNGLTPECANGLERLGLH